ncbi:hypothetical protein EJB05_37053, partial [Eragrostis curvula]
MELLFLITGPMELLFLEDNINMVGIHIKVTIYIEGFHVQVKMHAHHHRDSFHQDHLNACREKNISEEKPLDGHAGHHLAVLPAVHEPDEGLQRLQQNGELRHLLLLLVDCLDLRPCCCLMCVQQFGNGQ